MPQTILLYSDEIILKGKNRKFFEKILRQNIKYALKNFSFVLKQDYGYVSLELNNGQNLEKVLEILKKIPGIAKIIPVKAVEKDIEVLKKEILNGIDSQDISTFRVTAKRIDKYFPFKSSEINTIIGEFVLVNFPNLKVKLKNPDLNIAVKVADKKIFLSTKEYDGVSGLPVGSAGRMVCLLSGGIDSPIAAYMMMKRGVKVIFVHFANKTLQERSVKDKINKLVDKLSEYNGKSELHMYPFEEIQKNVIMKIESKYRMIIYRRMMMKIANEIAKKEKAKGLITGDNLSQVASQTLENINVIHKASDMFVASPLIGYNKKEIIDLARKIGTYDISILPYEDCCSFMIAKHPETRATLGDVEKLESGLDIK